MPAGLAGLVKVLGFWGVVSDPKGLQNSWRRLSAATHDPVKSRPDLPWSSLWPLTSELWHCLAGVLSSFLCAVFFSSSHSSFKANTLEANSMKGITMMVRVTLPAVDTATSHVKICKWMTSYVPHSQFQVL